MDEFVEIKRAHNSAEPERLDMQEAAYRKDTGFMEAISGGFARMLDGALLIRKARTQQARADGRGREW